LASEGESAIPTSALARALAVLLVAGAALRFLGNNVADPDLWGHLRYGSMMWSEGFPRFDVFSYTAAGEPFYDHEWLADFVFAGVQAAFGSAGLVVGKLLLLAGMLLAMVDCARSLVRVLPAAEPPRPMTSALVLVLGLAVIEPGATFRPQLFTMLLLALEGAILGRAEARRASGGPTYGWELAGVPFLVLVWANLHGGFLVGLGMFGLYLVATAASVVVSRRAEEAPWARDVAVLALAGLAGVAAPLVNPYGVELYTYLARTLDMHGEISESYPVDLLSDHFLRFKVLVLLYAVAAVLLRPRRGEAPLAFGAFAWRTGFLAFAAVYALRHQRHTVLFAIAATPFVIPAAERALRLVLVRWPNLHLRPPVRATVAAGFAAVALYQVGGWTKQIAEHGFTIRFGRMDYPTDAVEFLRKHELAGNVAMPFEWGAYAIWKLAPESRVFIDGRFEAVYPEQVIEDYFAFMNGTEGWERLLDAYPTDVVVVQRSRDIHPRLFVRKDLTYVYSDPASLVFVRRSPTTEEALDRLVRLENRQDFPRLATYFP